ncbi:ORF6C domain-containing protein [Clostridium massiliamazoniense]|uniref:ORF6C domain-containing protein n=1 Tax=Clostridium massiliamazoniense TaxID=1347366 RepID=UPI0006D7AB5D|nr:ORF6C domain-containing protein [Clostridium massiliamazoniense]
MNNLVIRGIQIIEGKEVKVIEGGFGEGQKCMLASDIAEQHNVEARAIQQLINRNIKRFTNNDLVNLYSKDFKITASDLGLITSNNQKYCYLLSERGYTKLVAMMANDNEKKWEVMDKLIDDYFNMRAEKRNEYHTPKTPEEIMIYQLQEQQKIKEQQQQMKQQINQVNHRTLKVENEIDNLPLLTVDCNELSSLAKRKIVALLGGKEAPAYKKCNRKAFSDLYKELHRNFGVTSMCAIKRKDLELAKQVIMDYKFPVVLKQEIDNINNQISMEMDRAL